MARAERARERDGEVDRQPALHADPQAAVLDGLGERARSTAGRRPR